ncbi:MAG: hypothetical protein V4451_16020 [Pseudomonadota bacterium]
MAEAKFYTYVHRRADTGEVFYVGKGQGKRAYDKKHRSIFWKGVATRHGLEVQIVDRFERERDAFRHEKVLIHLFREIGAILCNFTDGGEGCSGYKFSDEARLARNAAIKIAQARPEVKAKQAASLSAALKGKTFSAERRAGMSAAKKGRPLSESHRLSLIGKLITESHRAALKAANARPDVKARRSAAISATMKGYVKSDEHRANLAKAAREDWAKRKAKQVADIPA